LTGVRRGGYCTILWTFLPYSTNLNWSFQKVTLYRIGMQKSLLAAWTTMMYLSFALME
jgi:hypothetical protein